MDAFINDVKDTTPRGASRTRGENHVIQSQVAQNEARLRSARMFLLGSISEIWDEAQISGILTDDQLVTIRMASTWAIQSAREVVAQLYASAGALAIFNSRPFERRFRDIHTVTQQIQGAPRAFRNGWANIAGTRVRPANVHVLIWIGTGRRYRLADAVPPTAAQSLQQCCSVGQTCQADRPTHGCSAKSTTQPGDPVNEALCAAQRSPRASLAVERAFDV